MVTFPRQKKLFRVQGFRFWGFRFWGVGMGLEFRAQDAGILGGADTPYCTCCLFSSNPATGASGSRPWDV